ncbi:MAG: efflux transporter outer membrane subunit [Hyphomicrobiales bacterium]|nr:efflux transporter outer membrane subunit [Hyphomicrobiales bacterium]
MSYGLRTRAWRPGSKRLFFVAFLGLSVVQMLSGCILTTERPELVVDVPTGYRAGRGETAPPVLDWWRGFRSRELTGLIEAAQTESLDIGAAIGRIIQADAQAKIASAPLLPEVDFAGSATRLRPPGGPESNSFRPALNAAYELDFWGKNRAISWAAQENAVAARFAKEVVVLSTIVSVGAAYLQVLSSQDRLRIARQNLDAANRVLTLIKQRSEAGTASALDIAQQESVVATVRAAIPLFDQTLRQNIAVLAVLVGRAPVDVKVMGGSLYSLAIPRVTPGLPSQLLLQRPDIRAAEASLASANASVEAARAAFFPTISLTGQGGYQSNVFNALFTPQTAFYNLAVNVAQPLLDGFRLEGLLEQAQGRRYELLQAYCQSILAGFRDVEVALIAVADGAERERLQQQVVTSSRRAFQIAETRLQEGTVDLVTVLQTQQTLFTADDNLVLARLARLQAALSLFQALGGSWLPPPAAPVVRQ